MNGEYRTRTDDILLAKQVLLPTELIPQASWEGLEPPTNSLEVSGSIHLSYQDIRNLPVCASLRGMGGLRITRSLAPAAYETILARVAGIVKWVK